MFAGNRDTLIHNPACTTERLTAMTAETLHACVQRGDMHIDMYRVQITVFW